MLLVSSGMRKVPAWDAMEGPRGSSIRNGSEQGWGWWKAPTSDPPLLHHLPRGLEKPLIARHKPKQAAPSPSPRLRLLLSFLNNSPKEADEDVFSRLGQPGMGGTAPRK